MFGAHVSYCADVLISAYRVSVSSSIKMAFSGEREKCFWCFSVYSFLCNTDYRHCSVFPGTADLNKFEDSYAGAEMVGTEHCNSEEQMWRPNSIKMEGEFDGRPVHTYIFELVTLTRGESIAFGSVCLSLGQKNFFLTSMLIACVCLFVCPLTFNCLTVTILNRS